MAHKQVMFIVGEPSGDVHAARVLASLRQMAPELKSFGVGGPAMVAQGFAAVLPFEPFNRIGFLEVFKSLPFFLKARKQLLQIVADRRPEVVVLIDFPGFNMRMLTAIHAMGIPVLYYIAPKVWAWKRDKRAPILERCATTIGTIFPFEQVYYSPGCSRLQFVGNPLVEELDKKGPPPDRSTWADKCQSGAITVGLVPGSRRQEVASILPPIVEAFKEFRNRFGATTAVVSRCSWLGEELFACCRNVDGLTVSQEGLDSLYRRVDCALIASGTATLEAALRALPHIIVYKTSYLSSALYRRLLLTPWIGLPNIIAQKEIVPERYQNDVCAEVLAGELSRLVQSPETYLQMADSLAALRAELGSRRPSEEVPRLILEAIGRHA